MRVTFALKLMRKLCRTFGGVALMPFPEDQGLLNTDELHRMHRPQKCVLPGRIRLCTCTTLSEPFSFGILDQATRHPSGHSNPTSA